MRVVVLGFFAIVFLFVVDAFINRQRWIPDDSIRRMSNIAREDSLANTWSSTLLLLDGVALWTAAWLSRHASRAAGRRGFDWRPLGWALIAAFFTFLSFDDASEMHERVGSAVKRAFGDGAESAGGVFSAFGSYAWQLVFLPVYGLVGLFMLVFFWREFRGRRVRLLTCAAMACWVTAVGLDHVEGKSKKTEPNAVYDFVCARTGASRDTVEHYSKALEESLEMLGATLFLAAFLTRLTLFAEEVTVRFGKEPRPTDRATPPPAAPPAP